MTDEALVNALIERLGEVGKCVPAEEVARECLRQMEWARRKAISETRHGVDATIDEGYAPRTPLILAPEDWTP